MSKGQVAVYTFMLATVVILLAVAFAWPVTQHINEVKAPNTDSSQGLDCGNSSISEFQQAQCVLTDITGPYFVLGLLGIAGLVIAAKVIFG